MSLPDTIHLASSNSDLVRVFDPGVGVSHRTETASSGFTRDLVIIQSTPTKAGRQRHVIRFSGTTAPDATGKRSTTTVSLTVDRPVGGTDYSALAGYEGQLHEALQGGVLAAIIQGQQ